MPKNPDKPTIAPAHRPAPRLDSAALSISDTAPRDTINMAKISFMSANERASFAGKKCPRGSTPSTVPETVRKERQVRPPARLVPPPQLPSRPPVPPSKTSLKEPLPPLLAITPILNGQFSSSNFNTKQSLIEPKSGTDSLLISNTISFSPQWVCFSN
ncbi:hypothetical protein SK128_018262 [Halocaridina rubra]|uniref:Uncharacterized protein n=1 Tax=Halocaridina rubra TaxID=373956 RepID=A0AAN8XFL8_HALRR